MFGYEYTICLKVIGLFWVKSSSNKTVKEYTKDDSDRYIIIQSICKQNVKDLVSELKIDLENVYDTIYINMDIIDNISEENYQAIQKSDLCYIIIEDNNKLQTFEEAAKQSPYCDESLIGKICWVADDLETLNKEIYTRYVRGVDDSGYYLVEGEGSVWDTKKWKYAKLKEPQER